MSKKETSFPINTIGGRIQLLRHERGYTREELYDLVIPELQTNIKSSKDRTVRNWESNTNKPDYDTLCKMCDVLGCDADYLLCRIDHHTRAMQNACDITGLSEDTISLLRLSSTHPIETCDPFDIVCKLPQEISYASILNDLFRYNKL